MIKHCDVAIDAPDAVTVSGLQEVSGEQLPAIAHNTLPMLLKHEAQQALLRMFRDPYTLEDCERKALVRHLEDAVKTYPQVPEIRVLLGMALCVDLNAQPALEHLREAVRMAPDNFMARLKLGELLMRLRICGQAEEQTRAAAKIAINSVQAELARRQAAALRTMQRNGIERGGYAGVLDKILPLLRNLKTRRTPETAITLDIN